MRNKKFDCVKMKESVQIQLVEKISQITIEEQIKFWNEKITREKDVIKINNNYK